MNIIELRDFALSLPLVTEDTPFDFTTLCFRVNNKIFAITDTEALPLSVNLKCNPERALELRAEYSSIVPGYHTSKKHWNTIIIDDSINRDFLEDLIRHSYALIFNSLKVKDKKALLESNPEISDILIGNGS